LDLVRADQIIAVVVDAFLVPGAEMKGRSRIPRIAWPRQVAQYLMHQHTNLRLAEIGRLFEMCHTAVRHNVKAVKARCETYAADEEQLFRLETALKEIFKNNGDATPLSK